MKKLKSIPVIYVIITILASLYVISCKEDNPVTTPPDEPYQYDSARFNWKVDTLYGQGFYAGLWAKDTNDIFITNIFTNRLYRIQNGMKSYIQYPAETYLGVVTGDQFNSGYVVALKLIGSIYQPFFQKFDGNSFIEIPNPQDLKRNFFFNAVLVNNENEIWIGADGFIVKFDGSNLISYPLEDSTTKVLKFFYDESNKFKFLASIHHLDVDRTEFLIYEFTGSQWIKIFTDLNSPRPLRYVILNKYVSANNRVTIFDLVDSLLIPRINIIPSATQFSMDGFSFDNIIVPGQGIIGDCFTTLFHWNGSKWSLELCGYWVDPITDVFMINANYYYVISYDQNGRTYVMQGIKKPF